MGVLSKVTATTIEVDDAGHLFVKTGQYVAEDGVQISDVKYHKDPFPPGSDVSGQSARVQAVAAAVWTPEVLAAHQAAVARNEEAMAALDQLTEIATGGGRAHKNVRAARRRSSKR